MREKILELVKNHPRHYTRLIAKNPEMMLWIQNHTLTDSESPVTRIYSAVNQEASLCANGKHREVFRFSQGFTNCGPAAQCECTRKSIKESVIRAKGQISAESRARSNEKRKTSMVEKYGVTTNSQRPEVKEILKKPKVDYSVFQKLDDIEWLTENYVQDYRSASDIALELGVDYSTVLHYLRKKDFDIRQSAHYSVHELEVKSYIESLGFSVQMNTRQVIAPYEIDIYVPEKSLAIEMNGLYWHSFHPEQHNQENKLRHLKKTELAEQSGISLIHVTDYEWKNKTEIIKNLITTRLGINQKISARQCECRVISSAESAQFLDEYHLQGSAPAHLYYGLFYDQKLVMVMTFGKSRFHKQRRTEMIRMCVLPGFTIVGGISKLAKQFFRDNQGVSSFITYCDRSKSSGNGYRAAEFDYLGDTGVGYFWTDGNRVISRYQAQKRNLRNLLGDRYCADLSESMNMFSAGYRRYWDSGNLRFECRRR